MIRDACADDFSAITAITNHYIQTTTIHFAYEPLADHYLHDLWASSRERYPWVVAEDDNRLVVGYAKSGVWRDRAAYAWTTEIGLYVAPTHQRRGLGGALYERLLAELARRGFRSAIAGITLPNDPSRALHAAFGFDSVGVVRDAGYKSGAWHDVEFFQKRWSR
jgi:phosphinothricin acetyltransferase